MKSENLVPISPTRANATNLTLNISKEYQDLVPHQSEQEHQELIRSIKENGFWESHPIVINEERIILDGYHRWWVCQKLGVEPKITFRSFNDKLQEKLFVIDSNLRGRRHLNIFQRIELALMSKPILQEIAKRNQSLGGKGVQIKTPLGRIDQEIGNRAGSGKDSVRKVELLKKQASKEILTRLKSGKESINSAYNEVMKDQKRQEIILKAESGTISSKADFNDRYQLINNDFRKVKDIGGNSVDLIFTDPPYERKYITIYSDLAKFAHRTLVEGGSIVTYLRQYDISTIIRYMENVDLTFHWLPVIKLAGPFPRAYDKGVVIKQKPLLWFTKGKRRSLPYDYIDDLVESSSPGENKNSHEWAQSPIEAQYIISKLTLENQTVMDPMMGSGTTGNAALKLKRKFVGIEIDPKRFAVAKSQLADGLADIDNP